MKIGYNLYSVNPSSKVGSVTYSFGLLNGIINQIGDNQLILFVRKKHFKYYSKYSNNNIKVIHINDIKIRNIIRIILLNLGFQSLYRYFCEIFFQDFSRKINNNCDLFYTPTTTLLPLKYNIPTIVSMHDIQHIHYPQYFSKNTIKKRKIQYGLTKIKADFIHCSSDFIKSDLINNFNINSSKIIKIEPGIDLSEYKSVDCGNDNNKYFFYPAQLWEHKNHLTILKSMKILKDKSIDNIKFYFTGSEDNSNYSVIKDFIDKNNLNNSIKHLPNITHSELIKYYMKSEFVISAAIYEAASFPIFEAASLSKPIVASDIPSNIEFSNYFRINFFEATNSLDLANMIESCVDGKVDFKAQVSYNKIEIRNFSWDNIAGKFINKFQRIVCNANN